MMKTLIGLVALIGAVTAQDTQIMVGLGYIPDGALAEPFEVFHAVSGVKRDIEHYDIQLMGSVGGSFDLGGVETPFFCGGFDLEGNKNSSDCWQYIASTDSWKHHRDMLISTRAFAGSVVLEDGTLFIAGGNSDNRTEIFDGVTSELVEDFELFEPDFSGHCLTLLADGTIFMAGGKSGGQAVTGDTAIIDLRDPANRTITPATPMNEPRRLHSCATITVGEEEKVIAVGGQRVYRTNTTEIYDVTSDEWTYGPELPTELGVDQAVLLLNPDSGLLQLIGGRSNGAVLNTVWELDPNDLEAGWQLNEALVLTHARNAHVAFHVGAGIGQVIP